MALVVKHSSVSAGDIRDMGSILGSEDHLEKGMATYFSTFAWRIPGKDQLGGLWSIGSIYHALDNQQTGAGCQRNQPGGYSVETFSPALSTMHPTP